MNFPSLNGNTVDLIIIIFLSFYTISGWRRGFVHAFLDLISFILSLLLAFKFYTFAAKFFVLNFSLPRGISNALGFLTISFLVEVIFFFLAVYIYHFFFKKIINSKVNMVLGFLPSFLSGLVLLIFLFTVLLSLPIRPDVKQQVEDSKIGGALASQTVGLEEKMSEVFGGAVQDTLNFLTVKPKSDEVVDLNFKTNNTTSDPASEKRMFELLNKDRENNGMKPLVFDDALRDVGRAHCKDMFARGYFSHYTPEGLSPFDRMTNAGIKYNAAGENLAYAPTAEIAELGFMNSPGHRANILSANFGRVGIGVMNAGVYGRMFCQEFTD